MLSQSLNAQNLDSVKKIQKNANPYQIDYPNLDSKYYPYIRARNKYYDKDIKQIISNVDNAEKKNAFFLGVFYGFNFNVAIPFLTNSNIPLEYTKANPTLFGLHAGYQKYTGSFLPINKFGYQIYIDFCVSFGKAGIFFTGINADVLWDIVEFNSLIVNVNIGLGLGSAKITGLSASIYDDKYEPAYKINTGLGFRYHHQKIGLYFGSMQSIASGYLSYITTIGYDYVF